MYYVQYGPRSHARRICYEELHKNLQSQPSVLPLSYTEDSRESLQLSYGSKTLNTSSTEPVFWTMVDKNWFKLQTLAESLHLERKSPCVTSGKEEPVRYIWAERALNLILKDFGNHWPWRSQLVQGINRWNVQSNQDSLDRGLANGWWLHGDCLSGLVSFQESVAYFIAIPTSRYLKIYSSALIVRDRFHSEWQYVQLN